MLQRLLFFSGSTNTHTVLFAVSSPSNLHVVWNINLYFGNYLPYVADIKLNIFFQFTCSLIFQSAKV